MSSYCEECARDKGVSTVKGKFSLQEIIGSLVDPDVGQSLRELRNLKCPRCGLSYAEFRVKGRLGCAHDYQIFKSALQPLLEKIHGNTQHCGKVPTGVSDDVVQQKELMELRQLLNRAVTSEAYEDAAEIRDRIRELEEELEKTNG